MRLPIFLTVLLAGCATPIAAGQPRTGQWSAPQVSLVMGEASGRLDYDCAAGTIDGPLLTDSTGRFAANGTHTPGHGGPDRIDYVPPSHPARYSGSVSGDRITLVVDVAALGARLGPYVLRRGTQPNLTRCL